MRGERRQGFCFSPAPAACAARALHPSLPLSPRIHSLVIFLSISRFSSGGLTLDMATCARACGEKKKRCRRAVVRRRNACVPQARARVFGL